MSAKARHLARTQKLQLRRMYLRMLKRHYRNLSIIFSRSETS